MIFLLIIVLLFLCCSFQAINAVAQKGIQVGTSPPGPAAVFMENNTFKLNCTSWDNNVTWDLPVNRRFKKSSLLPLQDSILADGTIDNCLQERVCVTYKTSTHEDKIFYLAMLVVKSAKILDKGLYTCRFADIHLSHSNFSAISNSVRVFITSLNERLELPKRVPHFIANTFSSKSIYSDSYSVFHNQFVSPFFTLKIENICSKKSNVSTLGQQGDNNGALCSNRNAESNMQCSSMALQKRQSNGTWTDTNREKGRHKWSFEINDTRFVGFVMSNLLTTDSGEYKCVASLMRPNSKLYTTTAGAKKYSENFFVSVIQDSSLLSPEVIRRLARAPTIGSANETVNYVIRGKEVSLFVEWDALPLPKIQWWFFDVAVTLLEKTIVEVTTPTFSKLVLTGVNASRSGYYRCTISNWKGTIEKLFELRILDPILTEMFEMRLNYGPPSINNPKEESSVAEEGNLTSLVCYGNLGGDPGGEIQWWKKTSEDKEEKLTNGDFIKINTTGGYSNLILEKVTEDGIYKCRYINEFLDKQTAVEKVFKVAKFDQTRALATIISIIVAAIVVGTIIIGVQLAISYRARSNLRRLKLLLQGDPSKINAALTLREQLELFPYDKNWEISKSNFELEQLIGSGYFGSVYKAKADDRLANKAVAVKKPKYRANWEELEALICELKILTLLGSHPNVVSLLGACTKLIGKGELYIVMEYCPFGNLEKVLTKKRQGFINLVDERGDFVIYFNLDISNNHSRNMSFATSNAASFFVPNGEINTALDSQISDSNEARQQLGANVSTMTGCDCYDSHYRLCTKDLICWSMQIARGMKYLGGKQVVHGDLAARNILLTYYNVVKICDFGLSRRIYLNCVYEKKKQQPIPYKWLAIESLKQKIFNSQSDVWSYGILLWEIFSLKADPYPAVSGIDEMIRLLEKGERLNKPKLAPNTVANTMFRCWLDKPGSRPTFEDLEEAMEKLLLGQSVLKTDSQLSLASNIDGIVLRNSDLEGFKTSYL